jgi:DNA-binding CsgD family transcriptional regulator
VRARHLVGREEEFAAIVRFLEVGELPGAVVLRGEAGIGKTTLWMAGIGVAKEHGYRVLVARPSEAETRFSFGGLADLINPFVNDVLPELPPIQRRALEAALLLGESETQPGDRAVAAAFLGAVRLLSAESRLCLAIDDLQWLDAASLAALRYAVDRLDREPVAAVFAMRGGLPDWLRRSVPQERVLTVELAGLDVGPIRELLRSRLDATFPRPTLVKLTEAAGGNPFFVLELASALRRQGGTVAPGEELPIPSDFGELVKARLDRLGPAALDLACVVAALADPTVSLVESAIGHEAEAALSEAITARILELEGERLRFTHPLLRSAVAARQTPSRRRALHARAAGVVQSTEERARHLALATVDPDDHVASTLENAARAVHARGAPTAAAELAEHSLRLTTRTSSEDALRRLLLAADMHRRAGDAARATNLLTPVLSAAQRGDVRARILTQLADVQGPPDSIPLYYEALDHAVDHSLRATLHTRLATAVGWGDGVQRRIEHAELAVRAASHIADATVRCRALAALGTARLYAGRGIDSATMTEAMAIEQSLAGWPLDDGPTRQYGAQLFWCGDIERGRELFLKLADSARARKDPAAEAAALWFLGFLAWRAGDWPGADRYIVDSLDLYLQFGALAPPHEFPAAIIAAHRGDVDDARDRARRAVTRGEAMGIRIAESGHGWVLGFVELSLGDARAALVHLRRSYELRNDFMLEPAQRLELGDLLEALITAGELDEAEDILAIWDARAVALDRAWALAILARCRALLLAARGDVQGSLATFEHALAEHARSHDPFHHARTILALGRTQRRAMQRGAARETLGDAGTRFDRLGAPLWAAQARAELARIGGRRAADGELTEAERRIAALVAEGRPNREVAAALFLTEHSVEAALTRVYRKLGVRSRAALARRWEDRASGVATDGSDGTGTRR